jgi:hypothetical protein
VGAGHEASKSMEAVEADVAMEFETLARCRADGPCPAAAQGRLDGAPTTSPHRRVGVVLRAGQAGYAGRTEALLTYNYRCSVRVEKSDRFASSTSWDVP